MIIGISGKLNSGKDTVAQIINFLSIGGFNSYDNFEDFSEFYTDGIDEYPFKTVRFADKLKDCVCLILGCTREQLEDREFKETPLEKEWWYYKGRHGTLIPYHSESTRSSEDLIKLTPRRLMQLLGTDAGRNILHPDIWVNATMSEYKFQHFRTVKIDGMFSHQEMIYPKWIISDVRFKNEADIIKEKGGLLIRVNRPCTTCNEYVNQFCSNPYHVSNHQSEINLDDYGKFDYVINNDGTVDELILKTKDILIKEHII